MCGNPETANGLSHSQIDGSFLKRSGQFVFSMSSGVTNASRGAGFTTVMSDVLRTEPSPATRMRPAGRYSTGATASTVFLRVIV